MCLTPIHKKCLRTKKIYLEFNSNMDDKAKIRKRNPINSVKREEIPKVESRKKSSFRNNCLLLAKKEIFFICTLF